jgi:L-threonylcarbamoyladenylate synthase
MTGWLQADHPQAPARVAEQIRRGELIILPTDTVYGVGADPWQAGAVAALYKIKRRSPDRAIPVLLADITDISRLAAEIPPVAHKLALAFWPGPLTIAFPKHPDVLEIVSSLPTIGLRVPDHDATRAVIRACGGALAVTSANISGQPSPLTADEAASALGEGVALVLDGGPCPGGVPSTVVDVTGDQLRIIRPGPLDAATLRRALDAAG